MVRTNFIRSKKMRLSIGNCVLGFVFLASLPQACLAEAHIYSWTDENGTPVFSNLSSTSSKDHKPGSFGVATPLLTLEQNSTAQKNQLVANANPETYPEPRNNKANAQEHDALQDH